MRKYLVMAVLVILVTFGTYLYFFYFNSHQKFVIDSQKWSYFGGFIGGVLGPILSALALIAVSETLQNQKVANEYSQKLDEIKMRTEDLENISKQFESMINEPAGKLNGKSIYEAINDCHFKRCSRSEEIEKCAKVVVDTLINIANVILVIEEKKKFLFKDLQSFCYHSKILIKASFFSVIVHRFNSSMWGPVLPCSQINSVNMQ